MDGKEHAFNQIEEFFSDVSDIGTDPRGAYRVINNLFSSLVSSKNKEGKIFIDIEKEGNKYFFSDEFMLGLLKKVFENKPERYKIFIHALLECSKYTGREINFDISVDINDEKILKKIDSRVRKAAGSEADEILEEKRDEIKKEIFNLLTGEDLRFIQEEYLKMGKNFLSRCDSFRKK
ncbi:MAG: hypothetical protein CO140_01465 [Candidatus Moranbacteria bacterium CG_4_9_14_3_um_filter_40_7]|nr:MAG: hypothetical protein COX31_03340 [Candidatus Moranbacteria bacterium CG23_combo_of_CG06-09_8_20_14_all_40_16]PIU80451.1 MAG: hypothetical protein COS71_03400 [Candidatus Moranbacteria bacterium CG06_land_8_20_14_3_00_40_12]PJA87953.1 MAG: hypothetical protein CO140_01465 [Candidatus Moranbacteria bacterium CG_4_9_14_3_um_filter_40_7]